MNILGKIYHTVTRLALPAVHVLLDRREAASKEDPERIAERFGYAGIERPDGKLVWVHAASVGEAMSVLLLLDKLSAKYPGAHFLVTTGTVTSARLLATRLPPRAMHQFVPVDVPVCIARFLDHWRPDMALWIESEFWPNLLAAIARRGIPAGLLNARVSARSIRRWRLARGWIADMLNAFTVCLAQTESSQEDLRQLGAKNVSYCGNLKFAALPLPDDSEKRAALTAAIGARPVWLFASSHPGEEDIARAAHRELARDFPGLLTIIAPRHPARGGDIAGDIARGGLSCVQRSEGKLPETGTAIYLADTLGELGVFYRLCQVCCVGGSFVPVGGHNPIEPALLGAALCFGPLMPNFSEVAADIVAAEAARQVKDSGELAAFVRAMLRDGTARAALGTRAKAFAEAEAHIHDRIIAALAPVIERTGLT